MKRPGTLAEVARRVERGEQRFDFALSEFLDEFYLHPERRQEMIAEQPEAMVDPVDHAMLGAIGEHLARRWDLVIPGWTAAPDRFLKRPHFTTELQGLKALLLVESPIAFRRRLIFTEAEPLRRARMPRPVKTAAPASQ
jgi:hypothetical protein